MRINALRVFATVALLGLTAGADSQTYPGLPTGGRVEPSLAPQQCVCSPGINLAAPGEAPSVLRSCQCGSFLCVVHVQSGHLQCR